MSEERLAISEEGRGISEKRLSVMYILECWIKGIGDMPDV